MTLIPVHRFHSDNPHAMWVDNITLECYHPDWRDGFSVVYYDGLTYPVTFVCADRLSHGTALRYAFGDGILITIWE